MQEFEFQFHQTIVETQFRDSNVTAGGAKSKSAKDVHLNSFYPFFFILHGVQLPFLWLILTDSYFSVIIGNLFWAVAAGYYWYITFLGYK